MTGKGDDTQLEFKDAPAPPKPKGLEAEAPEVPSPLGMSLESLLASAPPHVENPNEGMEGSIFDDEPTGPMNSLDDIPDAIPNISDDGTEIL